MAEHFLDTETRHKIPLTALRCVEAGISTKEARDVWRYQVSPAVGVNLWTPTGEWVGWDRDWLVNRIRTVQSRWPNRLPIARYLFYRVRVHLVHRDWISLERCMDELLRVPPEHREQMAKDLATLARHYFDFHPEDAKTDDPTRKRLETLYPEPFSRIFEPALLRGSASSARRRIQAALSDRPD